MIVREKKAAPRHKMRGGQPTQKVPAQPYIFPAPINGWVLSDNPAKPMPESARILDNWVTTTSGARPRGGMALQATLGAAVTRIFTFQNGPTEEMFCTTTADVFDISAPADAEVPPVPDIRGRNSGSYAVQQFGTSGGSYMIAVNGADVAMVYDGTSWFPLTDEAINTVTYDALTADFAVGETLTGGTSGATAEIIAITPTSATAGVLHLGAITTGPYQDNETITSASGSADANGASAAGSAITLTGVDTASLGYVWSFANRLFFIEDGTMRFWYLPAASVGGAATSFLMSGVFKKGGSLLFGATWSSDSGDGLDDRFVLVTTEGEVAVYQGSDPSDATQWAIVGVYTLSAPMGPNAHVQAGGDLLIATEQGIVPISAAVQRDMSALDEIAVTRPIATHWQSKAPTLSQFKTEMRKVPRSNYMLVSQPGDIEKTALVVNMQTGAWARWTNLDTQCLGYFNHQPYYGNANGEVFLMDSGGSDTGSVYTCRYLGQFENMGIQGPTKTAVQARASFRAGSPFIPSLTFKADYDETAAAAPTSVANYATDTWDSGLWDVALWDSASALTSSAAWQSVAATGNYLAPDLQISFGITPTPEVELASIEVQFTVGETVT